MSPDKEKRRQQQAAWYVINREAVLSAKARSYEERRALHLCWEARRRAKRKGIEFSLTSAHIADLQMRINAGTCELTGLALDLSQGRKWNAPSIDRIDNARGYEHDNLRIVCHGLNAALGDWGEGPFAIIAEAYLSSLRKRRNSCGPTLG